MAGIYILRLCVCTVHCVLTSLCFQPWVFTEIKEQRHWDITSGERFNILKDYVRCGLEHWGSDTKGLYH